MNIETFSFDLVDKETPDVVIKEAVQQIERVTRGYVVGHIEEYDGTIYTYTKANPIKTVLSAFEQNEEIVDVQKELGEQNIENHKFEVFLTVKNLEHYKFRMMFVEYSTISYPVTIVLNESLALEYSEKRKDTYSISTMKELEIMMNKIINSQTMIALIQSLINEALRKEQNSL